MEDLIQRALKNSVAAKEAFVREQGDKVIQLVQEMVTVLEEGGKLILFGNGGSAADAQHVAAEFVNRLLINRPPLAAIALTTDTSILTAVGNDFSYDEVFSKQVQALGKPEDMALGISTSGGSVNVVRGLEAAREIGMKCVALTGGLAGDGGQVGQLAHICLNVPSDRTTHIQETHLFIEHLFCELVERELFGHG
ncbi:MAG: D-sedoheptulose 7-phosphate isomerase [Thermodesulfobacteriota bacterium]